MRLSMAGLDFQTASVEAREAFSLAGSRLAEVLRDIYGGEVAGCAIVSTCNRTELYLSHDSETPPDGAVLLCRALDLDVGANRENFVQRQGRVALVHLMRVAGGMRSSVLGDDQIITQVRAGVEAAREAGTADAMLEAVFRAAVAAGKKIKTRVSFAREGGSVAAEAVRAIVGHFGDVAGRRALVIGNGVIGRLAASGLREKGCEVSVTVRRYRHGRVEVPDGCRGVDYDERYAVMAGRDIVVSATSSPHQTIVVEEAAKLAKLPAVFVDLAIPRDIDPEVGTLPNVVLWNVDALKTSPEDEQAAQFAMADDIIADEAKRFEIWRQNRRHRTRRIGSAPSDFPVFINLHGATVMIAGGGKVAARRVDTLLGFGAEIRLVSPEVSPEMEKLLSRGGVEWLRGDYDSEHLDGVTLAIAATDDREVNRQVGLDARERGILVSVADRRDECSFYFPAIIRAGVLTAGLVSNNGDHALVKRAAAKIRGEMEHFESGEA